MKETIVIGLAGVKESGKSTAANMLKVMLRDVHEVAFADKLKNVAAEVFYVPRLSFDDQRVKEKSLDHPRILDADHIAQIIHMFNANEKATPEVIKKLEGLVGMVLDTPRKIAQIVGTEILRLLGTDIHCENVVLDQSKINIVSDLRFENEFEFFNNKEDIKFIPLYISRDMAEAKVGPDSHSSETSVFLFNQKCIEIDNNHSLLYTANQLRNVLERNMLIIDGNSLM